MLTMGKSFLSKEIGLEMGTVSILKKKKKHWMLDSVVRYETKNVVGYQEILPAPLESCK